MKLTALALPTRIIHLLLLVLCLAPIGFAQVEQAPPEETTVVKSIKVRYIGPATVDKERILSAMRTRVGDVFSQAKAKEDVDSIFLRGDVQKVDILEEPIGSGNLIVEVRTRAVLSDISFINNSMVSTDKLRKKAGLEIGDSIEEIGLSEAVSKIEAYYNERGFPDIDVRSKIMDSDRPGFAGVVFDVREGDKSIVREIRFEGNEAFKTAVLRKELKTRKKGFWSFLTGSGTISKEELEDDKDRVRNYYRDNGYLYADVVEMRQERFSDSDVDIVMVIEEGDVYTVSAVILEGFKAFDEDELRPDLEIVAGEPYSQKAVAADKGLLRDDYYGSSGYADARVEARILETGDNSISVTYTVTEGQKYRVRKVNFEGNDTKDKVLRREAAISPGDLYNTQEIAVTKSRLMSTGYFKSVDYLPAGTEEPGYKDVNFTVVEQRTGKVDFGASLSSIDNLVGFVNVTQTNFDSAGFGQLFSGNPRFSGGGQRFNMGIKVGTERRDFTIGLTEPWFMDKNIRLGGSAFYHENFFLSDRYDQREFGAAVTLGKKLGESSEYGLRYQLQNVEIYDLASDASPELLLEEGEYLDSALDLSYELDTRDSPFLARSGHRINASVGISGGFLGGDVDTYNLGITGSKHWNLPYDTIFTVKGGVKVVDEISGDRVPIFKRLFLGGSNNLRGFDYRDVSPKDDTGEPLGGGTAFNMTAEFTFPLGDLDTIRGAVFGDIGFVNEDAYDFSGSDLNSDVGIGMRIELPGVGPVRLDYGFPVQSDEFNDSGGKFNFYLGYEF